ncbi:Reticulon-4-interacting protein 1 [Cladobotryum mycophilum]|uniref:Reticulon-4-interacting protein 1 n=1 Tax=Cladobotryum mycophilum TaxID=491253 RepID=A0ABR0SQC1_9HYPO
MTQPTSKTWTFSQRGNPSDPEEWLLIKVAFAGLNVGSIFQMTLIPPFLRSKTCIPEMDLSGTVLDVWHPDAPNPVSSSSSAANANANTNAKNPRFKKGDKIIAMIPASHSLSTGTGALAQHILLPARYAAHKPPPPPSPTPPAQVLESGAAPGHRVLVNAASGGIGTMAVQILRRVVGDGGHIVGICSARNVDLVRSLGADEVIDYTQHTDLPAHLTERFSSNPFNTIIDTLGHQSLYLSSPAYLLPSGVYSSVGIKPPNFSVPNFLRAVWQMKLNEWWPVSTWLGGAGRLWHGVSMMQPTLEDRERIVGMLGRGKSKS